MGIAKRLNWALCFTLSNINPTVSADNLSGFQERAEHTRSPSHTHQLRPYGRQSMIFRHPSRRYDVPPLAPVLDYILDHILMIAPCQAHD
ncbi:hypothetical protein DSM25558_2721 [Agrobacterium sp. DSM 25558]|nr:hypothetical protein DSM25558_2721 [Agrobacterium sp. DSM 25558]